MIDILIVIAVGIVLGYAITEIMLWHHEREMDRR
jgi:hypothetical protein